jgi:hypothetical protein
MKTNSTGDMQWNKTYGGVGSDQAFWVTQTNDGGYAMIGRTNSSGAGAFDFWLVKSNSTGDMQWSKTYGGTGNDYGYSLLQAIDGGYTLVGYSNSFGAGGNDVWLIKTDDNGIMQWNKTYGGISGDQAYTVVQTTDGGYVMTGLTASFSIGPVGTYDAWLIKTDAAGNVQWNKTFGGNGNEIGMHAFQTIEGGYLIGGTTTSFGAGGQDAWLIKTDSSGNVLWNRTYGGINSETLWSMCQTSDGGFALTIGTSSFGNGTPTNQDCYLVKTEIEIGLAQIDSTAINTTLRRGTTDPYWNFVRVRIWKTT